MPVPPKITNWCLWFNMLNILVDICIFKKYDEYNEYATTIKKI